MALLKSGLRKFLAFFGLAIIGTTMICALMVPLYVALVQFRSMDYYMALNDARMEKNERGEWVFEYSRSVTSYIRTENTLELHDANDPSGQFCFRQFDAVAEPLARDSYSVTPLKTLMGTGCDLDYLKRMEPNREYVVQLYITVIADFGIQKSGVMLTQPFRL